MNFVLRIARYRCLWYYFIRKEGVFMIKFRLKVLLAMNDMNQKELSEKIDVRQPTISAICRGTIKEVPVGVLNKICAALKCQPGDVMEYIPDEE